MISQSDLEKLFSDMETDRVEKTILVSKEDKFGEVICAFTNDLTNHNQPGYLIVGVNDDGSRSGLKVEEKNIQASMKTIIFFNNKGGVGKTTLVYQCTHMLAELGHRCLAVDLDPQANLTSMFLTDEELERIYSQEQNRETLLSGIKPLDRGIGDIGPVKIQEVRPNIGLLAGDLELSLFEDKLSANWSKCIDGDEAAFRIVSAFYRIIQRAAEQSGAEFCLIDVGPNFGALNRATLIAADYVVVPMAADLFSLQGLRNLGDRLIVWKTEWQDRYNRNRVADLTLPNGLIKPLGYVVMQHGIKESRPVQSYLKWANRIPAVFETHVLKTSASQGITIEDDPNCLALLKHYHSLAPMAMEARKPIFLLKPADGAIGAHYQAVQRSYQDFKALTLKIIEKIGVEIETAVAV
jgi:chromosome partitioning protein